LDIYASRESGGGIGLLRQNTEIFYGYGMIGYYREKKYLPGNVDETIDFEFHLDKFSFIIEMYFFSIFMDYSFFCLKANYSKNNFLNEEQRLRRVRRQYLIYGLGNCLKLLFLIPFTNSNLISTNGDED
jgi:hypothetical protein